MFKIFVSVAIRDGERILLVQEGKADSYGKWNLPGGHLELGETLQEGAIREVREETFLDVSLEGLVGAYTLIRRQEEQVVRQAVRFVFSAVYAGGEPGAGDEILAVRWFTVEEMAQLTPPELLTPDVFPDLLLRLRRGVLHSLDALDEPPRR
jgi:8-oxo-dGTP diphosphatase